MLQEQLISCIQLQTALQRLEIDKTSCLVRFINFLLCMQLHEEISIDSNRNENSERQIYVVISVPGLNNWAKETSTNVQKNNPMARNDDTYEKSMNDDFEEMDCSEPVTKKAKIMQDANMSNINSTTKVQSVSEDHILNFPIPIDDGKACIVKVFIKSIN